MSKTAEGLRDRLFDTLDALIEKRIGKDEVEAICYTSEQIIKSAQVELEFLRERNLAVEKERQFQIQLKREEKQAVAMIGKVINSIEESEDE